MRTGLGWDDYEPKKNKVDFKWLSKFLSLASDASEFDVFLLSSPFFFDNEMTRRTTTITIMRQAI